MADFAMWGVACEEALGFEPGSFIERYRETRDAANELALDTSPLPAALRLFVAGQASRAWQGTATELLTALAKLLENKGDERTAKLREWPKRADKLSSALRRYAPNLRATGLEVEFSQETTGEKRKLITLRTEGKTSETSETSETDAEKERGAREVGGFATGFATSETGQSSETRSETEERASQTGLVQAGGASFAKISSPSKWQGEDI